MTGAILSLVGAGPGDPELITVKAIRSIKQADVILYDALANEALLDYAHPDAIKIITVAVDCAASLISLEISPDLVVPVVTQKLSAMPLLVRGIICIAGTANALETPGMIST